MPASAPSRPDPVRSRRAFVATLAAVALIAAVSWAAVRWNEARGAPNLVLITVDTLRADHTGVLGDDAPTTPYLDAVAPDGLLYERAVSQAPWTLPSMASLHTSLYPSEHGATSARRPVRRELVTLAEVLRAQGYHTIGVVSHRFVGRRYGMAQGFDVFDETLVLGHDAVTSRRLTDAALAHLGEDVPEPYFLWVHYFDPHFTYVQHPGIELVDDMEGVTREQFDYRLLTASAAALAEDDRPLPFDVDAVRATYDEEIAFTDAAIGRLMQGVRALEPRRRLVAALTSDHGEYFMERGRFGHGKDVYDELIHVPLVLWGDLDEALRGRRVARTVEVRSLARTFAELAGAADAPFRGEDLLSLATARADRPTFGFAEGNHAFGDDERKRMVTSDGWKLIANLDDGSRELYDLTRDPDERVDLWDVERPEVEPRRETLVKALAWFERRARRAGAETIDLSRDEQRHLESLGYVK